MPPKAFILYTYNLKGLHNSRKQGITHSLYGSGGRKSFLEQVQGLRLGRNNIIIPTEKEKQMDEFFHKWGLKPLKIMIHIDPLDMPKIKRYWQNG